MGRRNDTRQRAGTRSSRMYQENGSWYFNTREGTVVGPFRDEPEAYTQLEVYIRLADSGMLPDSDTAGAATLRAQPAV